MCDQNNRAVHKAACFPTLVTGDPAVSLSTKRSIPSRPNTGVALRHPLFTGIKSNSKTVNFAEYEQQLFLELVGSDTIWIVWRRSEGDREVAKCDVEE